MHTKGFDKKKIHLCGVHIPWSRTENVNGLSEFSRFFIIIIDKQEPTDVSTTSVLDQLDNVSKVGTNSLVFECPNFFFQNSNPKVSVKSLSTYFP